MKVLLVEDDPELRGSVKRRLRASGFAVDDVVDLPEARLAIDLNHYA